MNRLAVIGLCVVVMCLTTLIKAQERPTTKATGTVKAMQGGIIHVVNEEGDQYLIKLPDRAQYVKYVGSADVSFLKPGMFVRFQGRFDKKGNVAEPISHLEVFTPQPPARNQQVPEEERIGIFPEAGLATKELFADIDDSKKPIEELTGYRVAGRVTGSKNGKLLVAAGATVLQIDVADDAKVSIDVNDWRWMQIGDKVVAEGWYNPMQKSQIFANRIDISGSQPLGTPAKPKPEGKPPEK